MTDDNDPEDFGLSSYEEKFITHTINVVEALRQEWKIENPELVTLALLNAIGRYNACTNADVVDLVKKQQKDLEQVTAFHVNKLMDASATVIIISPRKDN